MERSSEKKYDGRKPRADIRAAAKAEHATTERRKIMARISLKNVVKHYDNKLPVIHGVDLDIADGEFMVFVGPSGCGKTTLLRMIAGLETITGGELHIGERLANNVPPAQRGVAMVFQSYALYPHMSVFENMAFGLRLAGKKQAEIEATVTRAADILQIAPLLKRKPKQLSGGQRQRVAIGRAIVRQPDVFLFDEPLSNLDASLRVQMRLEISRLHHALKTTMIYVTHDQVEAMTLGERIAVFNAGRIEQIGSPMELYNNPGNLFVAGFLGSPKMNFLAAEVVESTVNKVSIRLQCRAVMEISAAAGEVQVGDRVTVGIRAEHIALSQQEKNPARDNSVDVCVSQVENLGDFSIIYVEIAGGTELLAVKQPVDAQPPRKGDRTRVHLPCERCHLFDANGKALTRSMG